MLTRTLLGLSLAASILSTGCKMDSRLPEERAADRLEAQLQHSLEIEARRQIAKAHIRAMQAEYQRKVKALAAHYAQTTDNGD